MTGRKKTLWIVLGVLGVIILGIVILFLALDSIVASAIQRYGSQATDTPVTVQSVDISPMSGDLHIDGLTVANPQGFTTPYALSLGNISIKVDTGTLQGEPLVIEEIRVTEPQVYYEINEAGESNLQALQDNLPKEPGEQRPPEGQAEGPRMIINRMTVREGKIIGRIAALPDERLAATLPPMEFADLGAETNGAPLEDIARQIVSLLIEQAAAAAVRLGLQGDIGESLGTLRERLEGELGEGVTRELERGLRERLQ